ncbi:tRNA (pseudouridine(54)-N(1))-methyltransferase TrmY [Methanoregula sp.]|uniref:tRNA (pseudouridine(54)-N(1))-methyltransferase TrmY n=1 Tax=Methanoregula sp. TaxID=2052170 RepID=UPI003BB1823D
MTSYAIVGHLARTDGEFSLNDLPGAGRMDVLCRCVNASLFLSHDLRRDVDCYLLLLGGPKAPKTVLFRGSGIRSLSPDERSAGALVKKALSIPCGSEFREASPGVYVRNGGLERLFPEHAFAVLDEKGADIRTVPAVPEAFLLSDHQNLSDAEEELVKDASRYSVGPACLHADQTITVIANEIDRRKNGWK